ncbi:MAG: hypothetical protein U0228_35410 [Myxococcaceae bacterium]
MSARELFERIDARLSEHQREFIRPMAALTVRFRGKGLPHVGNAAWNALQLVLQRAPEGCRWRGVAGSRFAAARPMSEAGLAPVKTALAKLKTLPGTPVQVYVKDGSADVLAPEHFAVWLSLAKDWRQTFATEGGLLSVGLPLEQADSLVALGDELVEGLRADVAFAGPAVWLAPHCLFNSASNELPDSAPWLLELFGADPQLDAPHLHASRWPFTADEVKPDLFSGFLAPSWTMWLGNARAKRVTGFPAERTRKGPRATRFQLSERAPMNMTEALYAQWRSGWAALAPVHLTVENDEPSPTEKYFRARLSAPSFSSLLAGWRKEQTAQAEAARVERELLARVRTATESRDPKALELAAGARGKVDAGSLCWVVLPALVELVPAGKVDAASALVWLDWAEEHGGWRSVGNREQLTLDAAAVAAACGSLDRALALVREAFSVKGKLVLDGVSKGRLAKDQRFKALRPLPAWKKLVAR